MTDDAILDRTEYPPGVPCLIDTEQPDPEAAAEFYGGIFGWEFENKLPPGRTSTSSPVDTVSTSRRSPRRRPA